MVTKGERHHHRQQTREKSWKMPVRLYPTPSGRDDLARPSPLPSVVREGTALYRLLYSLLGPVVAFAQPARQGALTNPACSQAGGRGSVT